jgi:hypothetical protein
MAEVLSVELEELERRPLLVWLGCRPDSRTWTCSTAGCKRER